MESTAIVSESLLDACLKRVYDAPASITVVTGKWKTGKTDLSLRISFDELKSRLGIIKEVATNIKLQHPEIKYIDNFEDFEFWVFQNKRPKIFIYDEAIKSTPSRRAMSEINTKWLEYVPELSKGRCHLIVVTQEVDFTEKLFLHPTFVRAQWIKLDKTVADLLISGDQHVYRFNGIQKKTVPFAPQFTERKKLFQERKIFPVLIPAVRFTLGCSYYVRLQTKLSARWHLRCLPDPGGRCRRRWFSQRSLWIDPNGTRCCFRLKAGCLSAVADRTGAWSLGRIP